ncbi:MAG: polysaccharide deacetylase family protein, partial [Clostridia bacterium]
KVSSFEEQLKYIKSNDYDAIIFDDLDKLYKFNKPIMLTFDDGFEDFYYNAYPLLKKYNIRATLFVISNFLTQKGYVDIDMLKEMRDSNLVDIQCHSITHPRLSKIKLDSAINEIVDSKKIFIEKLNKNMNVFCYPYGDSNKAVRDIVSKNYFYGLDMLRWSV